MDPANTIGIDARMAGYTGIGTYIRSLLNQYQSMNDFPSGETMLYGISHDLEIWPSFRHSEFKVPIYSVQEQLIYPRMLKECRLWHAPHYNVPFFKGKTRLVVTIHDLIHWIFRNQYFNKAQALYSGVMLRRAIHQADRVITVSENTKQDLVSYFGADPENIRVIYEAVEAGFKPKTSDEVQFVCHKYNLPGNYFLYVGSLKPHKNVLWLIHQFRKLKKEGKIISDLVLAGSRDKRYPASQAELGTLETGGGVHFIEGASFDEIKALYTGALSLVHPSLYEGFGLTPLEAMACGTPVITTRNASIPEVVGEAACLVDSSDDHGMMSALIRMEHDADFRQDLIARGKARVKEFSWERAARQTAEVYEEVLSLS